MYAQLGGPATYLDATMCLMSRLIMRQQTLVVTHWMLLLFALATKMKMTLLRVSGEWINWFSVFVEFIQRFQGIERSFYVHCITNHSSHLNCDRVITHLLTSSYVSYSEVSKFIWESKWPMVSPEARAYNGALWVVRYSWVPGQSLRSRGKAVDVPHAKILPAFGSRTKATKFTKFLHLAKCIFVEAGLG